MDPAQQFNLLNDPNFREPPLEPLCLPVACSHCGMQVWGKQIVTPKSPCPRCGGRLENVTVITMGTVTLVTCQDRGEVIIDRRSGSGRGLPW